MIPNRHQGANDHIIGLLIHVFFFLSFFPSFWSVIIHSVFATVYKHLNVYLNNNWILCTLCLSLCVCVCCGWEINVELLWNSCKETLCIYDVSPAMIQRYIEVKTCNILCSVVVDVLAPSQLVSKKEKRPLKTHLHPRIRRACFTTCIWTVKPYLYFNCLLSSPDLQFSRGSWPVMNSFPGGLLIT